MGKGNVLETASPGIVLCNDFLQKIFLSVARFIVRIQYNICTYKLGVNPLFMFLVRLLLNSGLLLVVVWWSQKR